MAVIINSTGKTFCSFKDTEIRKTQFYLGYYENLELKKEVQTTNMNNLSGNRQSVYVEK